jgi:hypothetical protein
MKQAQLPLPVAPRYDQFDRSSSGRALIWCPRDQSPSEVLSRSTLAGLSRDNREQGFLRASVRPIHTCCLNELRLFSVKASNLSKPIDPIPAYHKCAACENETVAWLILWVPFPTVLFGVLVESSSSLVGRQ